MANPQLENGHTRIANEILEHLICAGLTGTQWDIVMFLLRKTWGWRKPKGEGDSIPLNQFAGATKRHRNGIARELAVLEDRKIIKILEIGNRRKAPRLEFNKDWESWISEAHSSVQQKHTPVCTQLNAQPSVHKAVLAQPSVHQCTAECATEAQPTLTSKETKETIQKQKASRIAKKRDADPRHKLFIDAAFDSYKIQFNLPPNCNGQDAKRVAEMLRRLPDKPVEKLLVYWKRFLGSQDRWHAEHRVGGHPIAWFAENVDKFFKQNLEHQLPMDPVVTLEMVKEQLREAHKNDKPRTAR